MYQLDLISRPLLITLYLVWTILGLASGACWDTGCQLDSWAVVGCEQYRMVETGRRSCSGGKIYSCCDPDSAPAPPGGKCWDTGCQLDSWAVVGCEQYEMVETGRRPCSGGNIYSCCERGSGPAPGPDPGPSPGDGGPASSITWDQFSNGVTYNGYPGPSRDQYNAFMSGLPKGEISTKQEAAMALANFLQESDGLRAKREYACASTGCPGSYRTSGCDAPGQYYYGRGYIQLSWCDNYKAASQGLYGDLRLWSNPDLVATNEQTAWDTAFYYWKTRVHNQAGVSEGRFGVTVRAINGGLECDGPDQDKARRRFAMYGNVRKAFGLSGPGDERGCYN